MIHILGLAANLLFFYLIVDSTDLVISRELETAKVIISIPSNPKLDVVFDIEEYIHLCTYVLAIYRIVPFSHLFHRERDSID